MYVLTCLRVAVVLVHIIFFCTSQNPSDQATGMIRPEMQATPWEPDVSSQVVSGLHPGSRSTLPVQPLSESPPQYGELPIVPARASTPTPDPSRSLRLPQK